MQMVLSTENQRLCVLFPSTSDLLNFLGVLEKFRFKSKEIVILTDNLPRDLKHCKYSKLSLESKAFHTMLKLQYDPHKEQILRWLGYEAWDAFYAEFKNFLGLSLTAQAAERMIQEVLLNERVCYVDDISQENPKLWDSKH